ncbi:MAG: hypothetical protein ACK559_14395, partial [bacterium]
ARAGPEGASNQPKARGSAPQARTSSSTGARSARWMPGGSAAGRGLPSVHKRWQVPGAVRPARPARCAQAA